MSQIKPVPNAILDPASELPGWTFLSNHAHVLLLIARDAEIKLRDVALQVGITERAVQRIVTDLETGGYLHRHRNGRRNHYEIEMDKPLRHPIESHTSIGQILDVINRNASPKARTRKNS